MPIISQKHHKHFERYGYMVIENSVPIELCNAVVEAIFDFLEMNPDNPDDWYQLPHKPGAGMVEMYQHQAMWNVYQYPLIHQIYTEIYGTHRIWVHPDRVNMKPPLHPSYPEWDHKGMYHWDVDTSKLPVTFGTQEVLFLTDTKTPLNFTSMLKKHFGKKGDLLLFKPNELHSVDKVIDKERITLSFNGRMKEEYEKEKTKSLVNISISI